MDTQKGKTPLDEAGGVDNIIDQRQGEPLTKQYGDANLDRKPTRGSKTSRPLCSKSRYLSDHEYRPSEEKLARRQQQVLELLKARRSHGATVLNAPQHLSWSLAARIHELRKKGYRIETLREPIGDSWIARYVLRNDEPDLPVATPASDKPAKHGVGEVGNG